MGFEKLSSPHKEHRGNILERAFDLLSSIPFLKNVMKTLWIGIIGLKFVLLMVSLSKGGWSMAIKTGLFEKFPSFLVGALTFGLMFYYWDKREKQVLKKS